MSITRIFVQLTNTSETVSPTGSQSIAHAPREVPKPLSGVCEVKSVLIKILSNCFSHCANNCTDGTKQLQVQLLPAKTTPTYCILHPMHSRRRKTSASLKTILREAIKIIDFIKASSSRAHLFKFLCAKWEARIQHTCCPGEKHSCLKEKHPRHRFRCKLSDHFWTWTAKD